MILSCAAIAEKDAVLRTRPATTARPRNMCLFIFVILLSTISIRRFPLTCLLSHHEGFQGLPGRIVLRLELLPSAVMGIATGFWGERMFYDRTVHAAGDRHPLDQLEVLARLRFVPVRGARREFHQMERRVVLHMTIGAARMTIALGDKNGLHLGLEKLVVQRRRCRLALCGCGHEQTRGGNRKGRGPLHLGTSC